MILGAGSFGSPQGRVVGAEEGMFVGDGTKISAIKSGQQSLGGDVLPMIKKICSNDCVVVCPV